MLEKSFGNEHKLETERKDQLAAELGLDPRQVAVWFQNRRARWKTKKLEEEFSKLRSHHDSTVLEKCRLQTEVLSLSLNLMIIQYPSSSHRTHTHTRTHVSVCFLV